MYTTVNLPPGFSKVTEDNANEITIELLKLALNELDDNEEVFVYVCVFVFRTTQKRKLISRQCLLLKKLISLRNSNIN